MKKLTTLFLFASMILAPICMQGQDLQFRYTLDGDANDSSTFMRNATNTGPVTFIADGGAPNAVANVADFDGTDDLTSTGYIGPQGSEARSGAMWIKTSSTDIRGVMEWGLQAGNGERWTLLLNAGALVIAVRGGSAKINTPGITNGAWHHIAFTYPAAGDLTAIKFYIDGVLTASDAASAVTPSTVDGGAVKIGNEFNNRKFVGQMSDVRLYSKELSAAEVTIVKNGYPLSLKGVDLNQIASIYPNPVKDRLYIKTKLNGADALNIKIYNTLGQLVNPSVYNKGNGTIEVDMKNLTPGLYFGTAKSKNASSSFKILKQ